MCCGSCHCHCHCHCWRCRPRVYWPPVVTVSPPVVIQPAPVVIHGPLLQPTVGSAIAQARAALG